MTSPKIFSLAEMRDANRGQFSDAQYIYYFLRESNAASDLLGALVRFLRPEFDQIDGRFLVVPTHSAENYRKYLQEGQCPSSAQYWANLLEITGLFECLDADQANVLADVIAQLWQTALMEHAPEVPQFAYKIEDKTEGEIFVTISDTPGRTLPKSFP